ncbi:Vacuolar protein sorting-associated protein 51 [Physocladia obscura]|uniref:Vacuolar protein sorting-associated protein 51 n=1 Tax=Physocladia obscura TaxID=109957 RepID=A0AAD5XHT5_9FUNG|nr:Vacuolar protein sorting-associated protein 51 [Physocladia obscura]
MQSATAKQQQQHPASSAGSGSDFRSSFGSGPDLSSASASAASLWPPDTLSSTSASARKRNRLKEFYNLPAQPTIATPTIATTVASSSSASNASPDSSNLLTYSTTSNSEQKLPKLSSSKNSKLKKASGAAYGPNPMDMDSPFFVPETFVSKCINETSLVEMLQRDNDLVAEIKELDASMKTLVYGNYNKFIAASDTIRDMRIKVDSMEDQMRLFEDKMATISNGSDAVHDFLAPKRATIRQLTGVHQLLHKLHFVFELPSKLATSFNAKKYKEAVLLYTETAPLLSHYASLSLFSKISADNACVPPSEISESFWLLGTLGRGFANVNDLATAYLFVLSKNPIMKNQMNKLIDATITHISNMKPLKITTINTAPSSPTTSSVGKRSLSSTTSPQLDDHALNFILSQIKYWDSHVLKQISDFLINFHDYFLVVRGSDEKGSGFFAADGVEKLSFEQRERLERELDLVCESFLERYFDQITKMIAIPGGVWNYNAIQAILVFDLIKKDVVPFRGLTLFMNMNERVRTYAVDHIKSISQLAFETTKTAYMDELSKIESQPRHQSSARTVLQRANEVLREGIISNVFPLLETFVDARLGFVSGATVSIASIPSKNDINNNACGGGVEGILELLTQCFEQFWNRLGDEMKILSGQTYSPIPKLPPTLLLLIMSRSALNLSSTLIDHLFSIFTTSVLKSRNVSLGSESNGNNSSNSLATSKRSQLIVVTAGGGTVLSATSGLSCKRTNSGASNDCGSGAGFKEHSDLDPRNASVLKRSKKIAALWKDIAKNLAFRFVSVATSGLCLTIHDYMEQTPWIKMDEPNMPDPCWSEQILGKISGINSQLKLVYDEEERKDRKQAPPTVSISSTSTISLPGGTSSATSSMQTRVAATSNFAKSGSSMFTSSLGSNINNNNSSLNLNPVRAAFGTESSRMFVKRKSGSSIAGNSSNSNNNGKFDAILDNIDRMFEDRVGYFGAVEMTREGILLAILRIVVKCYIEELRLQTLGTHGFHQVQIDSAVLKRFLVEGSFGVSDDNFLVMLADEMVTSGMKRCINPIMMAPNTVEALLQSK